MVEYQPEANAASKVLDSVFHALSDPTRRALLGQLARGGASVSALAEPHAMSLAAVSKHIKVLERAGLATREIDGRMHLLSLRPDNLQTAAEWVNYYRHFWAESLDRLDELFTAEGGEEPRSE